jgi:hypothetical protein
MYTLTDDRPDLSSERAHHKDTTVTGKQEQDLAMRSKEGARPQDTLTD